MILPYILALISIMGLGGLAVAVWNCLRSAPVLDAANGPSWCGLLSIVIPAFNERDNIVPCLESVLLAAAFSPSQIEVIVVDDGSTDGTWQKLEALQQTRGDLGLRAFKGRPRPLNEGWIGKNWACHQGSQAARGDYLLFLDADVRLEPEAILAAMVAAECEQLDLLTVVPRVVCECQAEWIVQPVMAAFIGVRFKFKAVNDPGSPRAFACGPFMLFRRGAYEDVGGHRAVAREVVEDVALARRVKSRGHRLRLVLGTDLVHLHMYSNGRALWEGWTKSIYFALARNPLIAMGSCGLIFVVFTGPWILLPIALVRQVWPLAAASSVSIMLQWGLRRLCARYLAVSARRWWLTGLGGAFIAIMTVVSMIKWETGWGWTWRGRMLKPSAKVQPRRAT